MFHNMMFCYAGEFLAPHPTPRLEGDTCRYPSYLEAVSRIRHLRLRHAVVTQDAFNVVQVRGSDVHGNETSVSIKGGERIG
jgi:hypothetical protein